MAVSPTYPGVYVSETTAVPHNVTPATTNLTAFIGDFPKGSTTEAVYVGSWGAFVQEFGAIQPGSSYAHYAVNQFFLNGGIGAWIVRIVAGATPASVTIAPGQSASTNLQLSANSPGVWGRQLTVMFQPSGPAAAPSTTMSDLIVAPVATTANPNPAPLETIAGIQILNADDTPVAASTIAAIINNRSNYLVASTPPPNAADDTKPADDTTPTDDSKPADDTTPADDTKPADDTTPAADATPKPTPLTGGSDSTWDSDTTYGNAVVAELQQGARLDLLAPNVFNLMCLPDLPVFPTETSTVFTAAHEFCAQRQAFLILDPPPPSAAVPSTVTPTVDAIGAPGSKGLATLLTTWGTDLLTQENTSAAAYYPWVEITDPVSGLPKLLPPSGAIAGVYATTDTNRGVWKAPAGVEAVVGGINALADTTITDDANGQLNVAGINVLRTFPLYGNVVWGARTLAGSTLGGNAFTYISSRRLADFIEQSLQQSLKWAVFEPNGPALWSSIQIEVTTFMAGLFGAGAFAGASAAAAYSVACDASTTSPTDMLLGKVNVNVAFAPVDPAEFVMLNVQIDAASAAS